MKTLILIILASLVIPHTVHAWDAEYNMQLADLQFAAAMLEREYTATQDYHTYEELMKVYYSIEAMEIDKWTCPFIEHKRAKQLCNVRWRNIFITGNRGNENSTIH